MSYKWKQNTTKMEKTMERCYNATLLSKVFISLYHYIIIWVCLYLYYFLVGLDTL